MIEITEIIKENGEQIEECKTVKYAKKGNCKGKHVCVIKHVKNFSMLWENLRLL